MELYNILFYAAFFFVLIFWMIKSSTKRKGIGVFFEVLLFMIYLLSFGVFALAFLMNSAAYDQAIDPVDGGYSPFGIYQLPTFIFYQLMFWVACYLGWLKTNKLPPLIKVLSICFLIIGLGISVAAIAQTTFYDDPNMTWSMYFDASKYYMFSIYPAFNILLAIIFIFRFIRTEAKQSIHKEYKNKHINRLNQLTLAFHDKPLIIVLFLFPVLIISTLILLLAVQAPHSLVTGFTETTCWRFSQMSHPDYLPHQGHYLCTVAARGDKKLVKPLRIGSRHGQAIIVNRQLMVANAFEELIQDLSPRFHRLIRGAYDTYGLPLSKWINTPRRSNVTYLIMKPLEWFFLIILYSFCVLPEEKIGKQYPLKNI